MPRIAFWRSTLLNHNYHHRGQLSILCANWPSPCRRFTGHARIQIRLLNSEPTFKRRTLNSIGRSHYTFKNTFPSSDGFLNLLDEPSSVLCSDTAGDEFYLSRCSSVRHRSPGFVAG